MKRERAAGSQCLRIKLVPIEQRDPGRTAEPEIAVIVFKDGGDAVAGKSVCRGVVGEQVVAKAIKPIGAGAEPEAAVRIGVLGPDFLIPQRIGDRVVDGLAVAKMRDAALGADPDVAVVIFHDGTG